MLLFLHRAIAQKRVVLPIVLKIIYIFVRQSERMCGHIEHWKAFSFILVSERRKFIRQENKQTFSHFVYMDLRAWFALMNYMYKCGAIAYFTVKVSYDLLTEIS